MYARLMSEPVSTTSQNDYDLAPSEGTSRTKFRLQTGHREQLRPRGGARNGPHRAGGRGDGNARPYPGGRQADLEEDAGGRGPGADPRRSGAAAPLPGLR